MSPLLLTIALAGAPELVDVSTLSDRVRLDIRYATEDNFFGKKVYPEGRCILRKEVAEMLLAAQAKLDARGEGEVLLLKDCYRPDHIQEVLWDAVKGTPKARYVANPHTRTGSIHAYAAAVDLTLADAGGTELDMGTPYDHLERLAEPRHEAEYLAKGALTKAQVAARRRLRTVMKAAGFTIIPNEWWHFNAAPSKEIRRRWKRLDVPFSAVPKS